MAKGSQLTKFEESIDAIEGILEKMESGDLPLEKLITHYDEAKKLLNTCQKGLDEAQLRIEKLDPQTGASEPFASKE